LVDPIVLVVGLGEIGRSLFELLKERRKFEVYGWDVDKRKMQDIQQGDLPKEVDVLHICYRCSDQKEFVNTTVDYAMRFRPELTIINSTVPPGTTQKVYTLLGGHVAHSPVRGMHETREGMKRYLLFLTKYIGGVDEKSAELARRHFEELGLKTKILIGSVETELAKLFETTYRGWMIACFQEMHRISRRFGADFDQVADFLEDDHRVRFDRPIHFPGVIGGHCLIPNAELLLESYDSEFIRLILRSNEMRKEEIKDPEVVEEVRKIQERVKTLETELLKI
jgi:UDP-N-acetyl-D-mannosaminuronate dehydrogenase